MTERNQRIRLGLFVAGAFIALATLIFLFSNRPFSFSKRDRFIVQFSNAPNMQPGTPVRRSGIKIGEVSSLELDEAGTVRVELLVDKRYPPRRNEIVSISTSLLSGDSTVDFVTDPERKDVSAYSSGDVIVGRGPLDTRAAIGKAEDLGQSAQKTLEKIQIALERFAPEVERTLREYSLLSQTIRETVPELRQTNDSIRRLSDTGRMAFPSLMETNEKAKVTLDNWNKTGERLNVLLSSNEQNIVRAIEDLAVLLSRINRVFSDENQKLFNEAIRGIAQLVGTENQRSFNSLLKNLNEVVNDENRKNLNESLKNARSISDSFNQLSAQLNKDTPGTMRRLNDTLLKAENAFGKIDGALADIRKITQPLSEGSGDMIRNLTYGAGQIGLLAKDLRDLLKGYAASDGTVHRLLTDPTLYYRASETVGGFQKLMPKLELILEDLKDFSDQIARHPNRLIFDRGAGLKGSPFAPTSGPNTGTTRGFQGAINSPGLGANPR